MGKITPKSRSLLVYVKVLLIPVILLTVINANGEENKDEGLQINTDPLLRYIYITYSVPLEVPDEIYIVCSWSPTGKNEWKPAKVMPYISETSLKFIPKDEWKEWTFQGRIKERCAQGLKRTVVFNPYPDAQPGGKIEMDFRIEIQSLVGESISIQQAPIKIDNSDIIYLEDWSQVLQKDVLSTENIDDDERKWFLENNLETDVATFQNALVGKKWREDLPLPQLTYPMNFNGWYAIYVCTPAGYGVQLRLSGDERYDTLASPKPFQEVLWKWCRLDRQHLIIKQNHSYNGYVESRLDYVKLVPLSQEQVQTLENQFGTPDRIVIGYFEPYSWAFLEDIQGNLQHREPIVAYKEARVNVVDSQLGRFGMKMVYETRLTDQLFYNTIGDPIGGIIPHTSNVGKMQQFSNTLQAELQYAHELGLKLHANFGATNCYPGTPVENSISAQHPEWRRGSALRYELPEVRNYILNILREVLEIGADGISIDFCRYPEGIDKPETCNQFLRELKSLREEFSKKRNTYIPLLIRFPAKGVRLWEYFDYHTWIREELVDYLCPSNIQGRHANFDVTEYIEDVRGTNTKLLPVVDGLSWGLELPGLFLWRVKQLYSAGTDGVYIYQADARVCINNLPEDRRYIRLLSSSSAIQNWWAHYEKENENYSRRIYLQPSEDGDLEYHPWERCRVWIEGLNPQEVEIYLDGKIINKYICPPYILGGEDYSYDNLLAPGEHEVKITARTTSTILSQTFTILGAK